MKHKTAKLMAALAVGALALFCIGLFIFWIPSKRIANLERAFSALSKGLSKEQVISAMGEPTSNGGSPVQFWEGTRLNDEEVSRISETLEYRVSTFYLPVTFRLSFDTNGRLVAKHRFD